MSNRTALITGASAGIGATFARHLAAEGYDLLLVARRAERLSALAAELSAAHGIRCEVFAADLTDPAAPQAIIEHAEEQLGMSIDFLVNNAGLSGKSKFVDAPWQELAGEIQLMITAVTELAHRVAPGMKSRGCYETPGGTIMMNAVRGLEQLVYDRDSLKLRQQLALDLAEKVYDGKNGYHQLSASLGYGALFQGIKGFVLL